MKKIFLTLAAITMVASFTSCKETPAESPEEAQAEIMETEAPVDVVETAVVEEDSLAIESTEVEEKIKETPVN